MPALSCSAMTCVYNQNELCSKGDIRVGGSCTFNDNCKCESGDIHIAGDSACSCQETECSSFRCGCGR